MRRRCKTFPGLVQGFVYGSHRLLPNYRGDFSNQRKATMGYFSGRNPIEYPEILIGADGFSEIPIGQKKRRKIRRMGFILNWRKAFCVSETIGNRWTLNSKRTSIISGMREGPAYNTSFEEASSSLLVPASLTTLTLNSGPWLRDFLATATTGR